MAFLQVDQVGQVGQVGLGRALRLNSVQTLVFAKGCFLIRTRTVFGVLLVAIDQRDAWHGCSATRTRITICVGGTA